MEFCPQCGAPVFSRAILDDSDEGEGIHLIDSGGIDYTPHLLQTVACCQLREICEFAAQGRLDLDQFEALLAELEVYLEREIVRFNLLPDLADEAYSLGCTLIEEGLRGLLEACQMASDMPRQGRQALVLAQRLAADADVQIAQGRQMLERRAGF